ncbi:hypothetical protein HDZ31DRAFT_75622 [Schizophyllum fasciatum]
MSKPYFVIPHIVQGTPSSSSPEELLDVLLENSKSDPHRDQTLRDCVVDEGAHEVVIILFSHTTTEPNGMSYTDHRVAKIERLKEDRSGEYTGWAPSYPQMREVTREQLQSDGSKNLDKVSFAENTDYWVKRGKLALVASFVPPQGALDIVDCAVAAFVLTERALQYSTLQFMCMWYARLLFETLRGLAGGPRGCDGPACEEAGRYGKIRLVSPDGRLKLPEKLRSPSQAAVNLLGLLRTRYSAKHTESELLAVQEDFLHQLGGEGKGSENIEPLREVEALVRSLRNFYWTMIEDSAREAQQDSPSELRRLQGQTEHHRAECILEKEKNAKLIAEVRMLREMLAQSSHGASVGCSVRTEQPSSG